MPICSRNFIFYYLYCGATLVSTTRFKKALLQLIGILTTFVIFYIDMTENDIAVRWGGKEFILFMPGTDINSAEKKLEKMQNTIREHQVKLGDNSINFTATIGLASGNDLMKYEQVINTADQMLYYGKNHGKNCIIKDIP